MIGSKKAPKKAVQPLPPMPVAPVSPVAPAPVAAPIPVRPDLTPEEIAKKKIDNGSLLQPKPPAYVGGPYIPGPMPGKPQPIINEPSITKMPSLQPGIDNWYKPQVPSEATTGLYRPTPELGMYQRPEYWEQGLLNDPMYKIFIQQNPGMGGVDAFKRWMAQTSMNTQGWQRNQVGQSLRG